MRRLVYSPKAFVYIKTDVDTYNISDMVVSGTVTRKLNQVSTAEVTFQNPDRMFTNPGNPTFRPMDKILIFLQRLPELPVLTFTGYLDSSPYYQMYPGTCSVTASCTLKRLKYTYLDPGLPFMLQFLARYGWVSSGNGSISTVVSASGSPTTSTPTGVTASPRTVASNRSVFGATSGTSMGTSTAESATQVAADKVYSKAVSISNQGLPYVYGGGHTTLGTPSGGPPAGYDCSGYVSACLGAGGWLSSPEATGGLISWGDAGEGSDFTVWVKDDGSDQDHAYIEFKNRQYIRADTSAHGDGVDGPHVRSTTRSAVGFSPRRPTGSPGSPTSGIGGAISGAASAPSLPGIEDITENIVDTQQSASLGELLFASLKHIAGWDPNNIFIEELPKTLVDRIMGIYTRVEEEDKDSLVKLQAWIKAYIGTSAIGSGGMTGGADGTLTTGAPGGGVSVGASNFGGHNDPSAYLHSTASGAIANDTLVGYAELSTNPSGPLDFSALSQALGRGIHQNGLALGTKLRVTYGGKSVVIPKVDNGGGGGAVTLGGHSYPRCIDLTYAVAQALGVLSAGTAVVQVELVDSSTPTSNTPTAGGSSLLPGTNLSTGVVNAATNPYAYTPSGNYGFFPAADTNYTNNDEPELAARLNALGIAQHLHLIGLSGYRTPQHSMEVGGFADDPHTRGEASDTPGVEGVSETILNQYGLTRPFSGSQELDHIQLLPGRAPFNGATGPVSTGNSDGGAVASAAGVDPLVAARAASVFTTLNFPQAVDSAESNLLTGEKSLMNDQPLLPFIEQLAEASLRSFQSLPNGDFYAFTPDYFGTLGSAPYWSIDDVEILEGNIQLNDDALATHVYVTGATLGTQEPDIANKLASTGVVNILNVGNSEFLNLPGDGNDTNKNDFLGSREASLNFLKRYGPRPVVEDAPFIRSHVFETFFAYQKFMLAWSRQFMTTFSFTFMPEIFPGGLVAFRSHGIQMYVDEVQHTWDYMHGFTTQANLSAPSAMNNADPSVNKISTGMVRSGTTVADSG